MLDSANYRGKQKLQNLVFPEGMVYDRTSNHLLTPRINEVFGLIHQITGEKLGKKKGEARNFTRFPLSVR